MGGRTQPLILHGPHPAKRLLRQAVHLGVDALPFPLEIVELGHGASVKGHGYTVGAVQVDHRVSALAYVLQEDERPGRFNLERARALFVREGQDFGRLQRGESVTASNGQLIRPADVLGPARPGRRIVVSGDTRPCVTVVAAAREADLLIHEATFSDEEQERALETRHSTAREAGRVAKEAGARRLILTHLSSRYDLDSSKLLNEAREEYAGPIEIAHDGMIVELPLRD